MADVTGSEKSPPGGDTLRKEIILGYTLLLQSPMEQLIRRERLPSSVGKLYLRPHNTDTALPLGVAQALDASSTLVEGGQPCTQVSRVTTVCTQKHTHSFYSQTVLKWNETEVGVFNNKYVVNIQETLQDVRPGS